MMFGHGRTGGIRYRSSFLENHAIHIALLLEVGLGPFNGEEGSFKELLVGVFPANILPGEVLFHKLLDQHGMSG